MVKETSVDFEITSLLLVYLCELDKYLIISEKQRGFRSNRTCVNLWLVYKNIIVVNRSNRFLLFQCLCSFYVYAHNARFRDWDAFVEIVRGMFT